MKKVLILTVTAGNGHNSCANAMREKLSDIEGVEVRVVDILKEFSTPINHYTMDKGYSFVVANFLYFYNLFFENYKKEPPERRYRCGFQNVSNSCLEEMLRYIYNYQPDVIYGTHVICGIAITNLRMVYDIPARVILPNLDYVNAPFWEAAIGVDFLTLPNSDFVDEFLEEGFRLEQLVPMGIPVNEKFSRPKNRKECAARLNIDSSMFTIMVMFGGGQWTGGFSIFRDVIKAVEGRKVQVIMINGRDEESFSRIEKNLHKIPSNVKIVNVGYTYKIDEYMASSDIIITKMGGLSSTEFVNMGLPFVVTETLAAQERWNLKYFKDKGIAKSFSDVDELREHIGFYYDNPNELEKVRQRLKPLKTNGIQACAELILSAPKACYNQEKIDKTEFEEVFDNVKEAMSRAYKIDMKHYRSSKKIERTKKNAAKIFSRVKQNKKDGK